MWNNINARKHVSKADVFIRYLYLGNELRKYDLMISKVQGGTSWMGHSYKEAKSLTNQQASHLDPTQAPSLSCSSRTKVIYCFNSPKLIYNLAGPMVKPKHI